MKYIIPLYMILAAAGCKTNQQTTPVLLQYNRNVMITQEDVNGSTDSKYREHAKQLGIKYVDYLHLVNNNKLSVTPSDESVYIIN